MDILRIVVGAAAGLAFGLVLGYLKNRILWIRYLKKTNGLSPEESVQEGVKGAYTRLMISYVINIAALLVPFFLRNYLPFDGIACLIATAVALSIMNKLLAGMQKRAS